MTPEHLAEIRARYAAALGGSWRLRVQDVHDLLAHVEALEADKEALRAALRDVCNNVFIPDEHVTAALHAEHPGAALLEQHRLLRQEVEEKGTLARAWEEQYKSAYRLYRDKGDAWDAARAEVERLRARVAELEAKP